MLQESNSSPVKREAKGLERKRTVYEGFVTLTEETLSTDHGPYPYLTVHTRPLSVIVLPQRADGKWLVTREWRHPVSRHVYSFPGGLVDEHETPLEAGERELLEETGFAALGFTLLGTCYPLPGLLDQTMSVIIAHDIQRQQEPVRDNVEDISFDFYSLSSMRELFHSSSEVDAMALAAMAKYLL